MTKEIALTRGYVALVDDEDYERLSQFRWYPVKGRKGAIYASRTVSPDEGLGVRTRQMQRDVLDPKGVVPRTSLADHIDRQTLDNRRSNLRWASYSQSNINRSGQNKRGETSRFVGVHYCNTKKRFIASIRVPGRTIHRQCQNEKDAARAYDVLAREYRGVDAALNFPDALAAE